LRRYKVKRVKTRSYQEGVGQFEPRLQGNESALGNIFWFLQNWTHFAIWQCKLHHAMCSHFGRQTDGIAVASTVLVIEHCGAL